MNMDRTFPLDSTMLSQYEHVFGADLTRVRIHTGPFANKTCREHSAEAVTIGYDIYFADGRYSPDSDEGIRLLAHELQHVVQHQRGDRIYYDDEVMEAEHQAEKAADSITGELLFHLDSSTKANALPESSPTSPFKSASGKEDTSGNTKEQTLEKGVAEENKSDDFMDKSDFHTQPHHALYEVMFRDGSTIDLNKGEMETIRRAFEEKVNEWIREESYTGSSDEYERKVLKFLELMKR